MRNSNIDTAIKIMMITSTILSVLAIVSFAITLDTGNALYRNMCITSGLTAFVSIIIMALYEQYHFGK